MTREELEKSFSYKAADAAFEHHKKFIDKQVNAGDIYDAFVAGITWEHTRLLRKASEWLKGEVYNYVSYDGEIDKELIEDFRKAMEE